MMTETDALHALASWERAIVPLSALPGLLGLPEDAALDLVADLEAAGLVETWDDENDTPTVILSSLAAEMLDLELVPPGLDRPLESRWVKKTRKVRADVLKPRKGVHRDSELSDLDVGPGFLANLADPRAADPAVVVPEALDRLAEFRAASAAGKPPRGLWGIPVTHYGLTCIWPVAVTKDGRCEACGGRWARGLAICVTCNRCAWIDAPGTPPIPERVGEGKRRAPTPLELAREFAKRDEWEAGGRAARKAARKAKRVAGGTGEAKGAKVKATPPSGASGPYRHDGTIRRRGAEKAKARREERRNAFDLTALRKQLG